MLVVALFVALTGVLVYFIYMVIRTVSGEKTTIENTNPNKPIPFRASFEEKQQEPVVNQRQPVYHKENDVAADNSNDTQEGAAAESDTNVSQQTPDVVGQSTEELKAPEQLQERVSLKAETHSALDPYEKDENVALFGSNLRHPEASMEKATGSFGSLENEIVAGLASQVSKPAGLEKVQFAAEMAQNGGEFMNGIFAYDSSDVGTTFSTL